MTFLVCSKNAGISDATKYSLSPTPITSGDSCLAAIISLEFLFNTTIA